MFLWFVHTGCNTPPGESTSVDSVFCDSGYRRSSYKQHMWWKRYLCQNVFYLLQHIVYLFKHIFYLCQHVVYLFQQEFYLFKHLEPLWIKQPRVFMCYLYLSVLKQPFTNIRAKNTFARRKHGSFVQKSPALGHRHMCARTYNFVPKTHSRQVCREWGWVAPMHD